MFDSILDFLYQAIRVLFTIVIALSLIVAALFLVCTFHVVIVQFREAVYHESEAYQKGEPVTVTFETLLVSKQGTAVPATFTINVVDVPLLASSNNWEIMPPKEER